jgi:xylulokinase
MYLLGIDLGTTGCKSMVFDLEGNILGDHYIEYDLIFTPEGVEQDANLWWDHVKTAIQTALRNAAVDGKKVLGLSISSQGISFVPIDEHGNTLMNAISWYDTRAMEEADAIKSDYDNFSIYTRTGRQISSLVFPEVMWLKKHRNEIYEKTYKFLMGLDFLVYRFTGRCATDYTMASGTLCFDTVSHEWISEFFQKYDIDKDKFPSIFCFGDVIGTVLPEVADELGLSTETKVVMGLQDQKAAAVGAGIDHGIITVSLGTASAISSLADTHVADKTMAVACHGFSRDSWILENSIGTAGAALKWAKNTMFPHLSYAEMDVLAEQTPAGSNGVFFYPKLYKGTARTNKGFFSGLGLEITQGDLIRSVLEGIGYEIQECITAHQRISQGARSAEEIRIFGGGATSSIWCQIIADITNMKVVVPRTHETGNLGAALCAGIGAGVYKDLKEAKGMVGGIKTQYVPNLKNHEVYKERMNVYTETKKLLS